MPISSRAPCSTSPPTGRQPWEPGWVQTSTALPAAWKSRTAATRWAAHTQVPEKRIRQSTRSSFFSADSAARASALEATTTGCSTSRTPAASSAARERATIASSMKGRPMGSCSPSLCTP